MTADVMKAVIGARPAVAAAASCSVRTRPSSSPASSQVADAVTSSSRPDQIRMANSRPKIEVPEKTRYGSATYR